MAIKITPTGNRIYVASVKREDEESSSEIMQLQAGASPIRNPLKRKGANAAQSSDLCTTVRL
jgi:hypothetical protein